jgi:hypothetical protein
LSGTGVGAGVGSSDVEVDRYEMTSKYSAMRIEARDLVPYAEPVGADDLIADNVYFSLTFADDDMCIPLIETLVFIGRDLEKKGSGKLYFQDVESHRRGVRFGKKVAKADVEFFICRPDQLSAIFGFDKALDELLRCSSRRSRKQS